MPTYFWLLVVIEVLLRRGSCALLYNQTTAVVLCDMVKSFPKLKSLSVPWSCPDTSAIKSFSWCQQRWTGISCNPKKLIISLTLGNQGLVGTIPNTIGLLTSLNRYLWINNNRISGTIPTSLGNLTLLTSIRLDQNSLSGRVPYSLTKLSKLFTLNLNDNYLTGSLPALSRVTYNDDAAGSSSSFNQLTHYPSSQPTGQPSGQPTSQPSKNKIQLTSAIYHIFFLLLVLDFVPLRSESTDSQTHNATNNVLAIENSDCEADTANKPPFESADSTPKRPANRSTDVTALEPTHQPADETHRTAYIPADI